MRPLRPGLLAALLLAMPIAAHAAMAQDNAWQVERYRVSLRPDVHTGALAGDETIELRASAGVSELTFSGNALRIRRAELDGVAVQASSQRGMWRFRLGRAMVPGERATLRLAFDGMPARGVHTVPGGMYTAYFACDWMVCRQDVPGDKAWFDLDLYLPAGTVSLAPGRSGRIRLLADGMTRHRWRSTRPYSAYLYAFAAGRFAERRERTAQGELRFLDATGSGLAAPERLRAQSSAIAAFLAEKAGLPLPDRRYTQLVVPGDEAQEAAGFSLIGQDVLAQEQQDPGSAWVVAHETAHQWWGNLVTCASWQEFWLNEGLATSLVAAWREREQGRAAYLRELEIAERRLARARAVGFDKPLAWSGAYPSLRVRRAVQYSKGALFLATLRETVGDAPFWRGLRLFTRRHAGGTVTSRDLQAAMEQAGRRDLSSLFDRWVYDGGPSVG